MYHRYLGWSFLLQGASLVDANTLVNNRAAVVSQALAVQSSQLFQGNDGAWSSFVLRIGTPAQYVNVFVSTQATATWVVLPEGCSTTAVTECTTDRGGVFLRNASTSWSQQGLYTLGTQSQLEVSGNGIFGNDSIGFGYLGSGSPMVQQAPLAGIATNDSYLGQLAINPRPINYSSLNDLHPSLMSLLKQQNLIPSLSFGYTAGAPYRFKKVLGSLTLGGYDSSRYVPQNLTLSFGPDDSRDLLVAIRSISTDITGMSQPIWSAGAFALIDPTITQLWLPLSACQAFEAAFGLVYNTTYDLYLLNTSTHQNLLSANPNVTIVLGNSMSSEQTVNITFPYAAFDLKVSSPIVDTDTPMSYFPLGRAQNDSHYTLGRTFLQEAYLTVNYENKSFTVQPCKWDESATAMLIAIPPSESVTSTEANHLGTGAIVGIVVGIIGGLLLLIGAWMRFRCIPRQKRDRAKQGESQLMMPENELAGEQVFEAAGSDVARKTELELEGLEPQPKKKFSEPIYELGGSVVQKSSQLLL